MPRDSTEDGDLPIDVNLAGRTNPPQADDLGLDTPPPADGHPVAASDVQDHLDGLVRELHHGPGSHDDPNLPDGPSAPEVDDDEEAGADVRADFEPAATD